MDQWLRSISDGYVNLERIRTVAGALPVIGNIMSLVDALCDIIAIITKKASNEVEAFFNWVSLAINLIGIVPGAGGPVRMGLRPLMQVLRQKLKTSTHDIGVTVLVLLQEHVNSQVKGELEKFVTTAQDELNGLLAKAGILGRGITASWSEGCAGFRRESSLSSTRRPRSRATTQARSPNTATSLPQPLAHSRTAQRQ
ncbi:hypothetical protein D3C86_1161020 [compost metagenome]